MIKDMTDRQRSIIKRSDITLQNRIGKGMFGFFEMFFFILAILGASGEVFKGMLRGTEVAIKRLVTTHASTQALQEFELECAIMAYVTNILISLEKVNDALIAED
jgi:hypothetical protein